MNTSQQHEPGKTSAPAPGVSAKAVICLVLAIVAPAGFYITAPLGVLAVLMTYPDEGPSPMPWVAPLIFLSLPLLSWLIAVSLAVSIIRRANGRTASWGLAVASLWVSGIVFLIGLFYSLTFVPGAAYVSADELAFPPALFW